MRSLDGGDPGVYVIHPDGKVEKLTAGSAFYLGDTILTTQGTVASVQFVIGGEQGINGGTSVQVASERTLAPTNPSLLPSLDTLWASISHEKNIKALVQTNGGVIGIKG